MLHYTTLRRRLRYLLASAVVLGVLSPLASGQFQNLWWHLGTIGIAAVVLYVVLEAPRQLRNTLSTCLVIAALALCILTISVGLPRLMSYSLSARLSLFFENSNLLAAAIATFSICASILKPRFSAAIVPLAALALLFTGSRTALIAYIASLAIYYVAASNLRNQRSNVFAIVGACFIGIGISYYLWYADSDKPTNTNLLEYSANIAHPVWSTANALEDLHIEVAAENGPLTGGTVFRVAGSSSSRPEGAGIVLAQAIQRSVQGTPYIGSVYLKSHVNQEVIISTNLQTAKCQVERFWSRCTTPIGFGNNNNWLQFQLRTAEPGATLDLLFWGPQVEVGVQPTMVEHTGASPLQYFLDENILPRVQLWGVFADSNVVQRFSAYEAAWALFMARPLGGVGLGNFSNGAQQAGFDDAGTVYAHAHNLPLQLLSETGILGFLSWCVLFLGTAIIGLYQWRRFLPLFACVLLLNTADVNYYHWGVYYAFWFTVATLFATKRDDSKATSGY